MKIETLSVKNYRALKDVKIPVSSFVCLTGENNAGKSSLLQALSLFLRGSPLNGTNFFDPSEAISVTADFSELKESDLSKLAPEHRAKIEPLVINEKLTLMRRWGVDGKSQLGYIGLVPKGERFQDEFIKNLTDRQKPGVIFRQRILETYPELTSQITNVSTQAVVKEAIKTLGESEPAESKEERFIGLPTGIGPSIAPMLPEPIYIPAVKDLRDETKTGESSPFGKILSIVMDWIEPDLGDAKDLFDKLSTKLTRTINADGSVADERLPDVKRIESKMQEFLQESFSNVSLELDIPPPSIKSVLSGAQIFADDGVKGPLDLKGDGLRRAIVFSILRTYVEFAAEKENREAQKLAKQSEAEPSGSAVVEIEKKPTDDGPSYILLYEEPELFLHPDAQRILFEALRVFSRKHQVVVTTHSPLFLAPESTETFVRLSKTRKEGIEKPFTNAHPISITLEAKDAFQIICFENNNAAFFAKQIVLVEGDTDVIVFPHIAKLLNHDWQCSKHSVAFCKILGKGNIRRYKNFFTSFGVPIYVIGDLDVVNEGFEHIEPNDELKRLHKALNDCINHVIAKTPNQVKPNAGIIKEAQGKTSLVSLWEKVKQAQIVFEGDPSQFASLNDAVCDFFSWERKNERREVLREAADPDVFTAKSNLLAALRRNKVYLLEKGDIEAYYPESVSGKDKPSKAQDFCAKVSTREQALACCGELTCPETAVKKSEFEFILEPIFSGPSVIKEIVDTAVPEIVIQAAA